MDVLPFEQALDHRVAEILDRCTTCGDCASVCPMPGPAGLDASDPQALTAGVLALLRGGTHAAASQWASGVLGQRALHTGLPAWGKSPADAGFGTGCRPGAGCGGGAAADGVCAVRGDDQGRAGAVAAAVAA